MNELKEAIWLSHNPNQWLSKYGSMVYQVWEDGEVTLQKSGSLFNLRTLHLISSGRPDKALPDDIMPVRDGKHAYCFCAGKDDADYIQKLIFSL